MTGAGRLIARLAAAALMLAVLGGCEPASDTQQEQANAELRGIVASDRQQIDALQNQVARLNDRLAEMEHNDQADGSSQADRKRLAELEREVQSLRGGAPGPTGAPPIPVPGAPNGAPGAAAPGPMAGGAAMPAPGAGPAGAAAPGAAAGAPADDSADTANDNDTGGDADDDTADNGAANGEVAANAPPPAPAPPPPAPAPALVAGSPSWRGLVGREMAAAQASSDSAARIYRSGLVSMKAHKYAQAAATFQTLQRKYPKSSFSEPAEYFSANALYELGKYDQSILQFNDLVMRYPRGRFASASLLSEAQAFIKMNDRIDARLTLQKLLDEHPSAAEAPTARAMISSLANG